MRALVPRRACPRSRAPNIAVQLAMLATAIAALVLAAGCGSSTTRPGPIAASPSSSTCPAHAHLRASSPVRVGSGAGPLALDGGSVWVARPQAGTVTRVGVGPRRTLRLGGAPVSLAIDGTRLWVAQRDAGEVISIDTHTLARATSSALPLPVSVAAGPLGVWALSLDNAALYPLAPASGGLLSPIDAPVRSPIAMLEVGAELWVLGAQNGGLSPVNGRLGRIVRAGFDLPGRALTGMSTDGSTIWIAEPTRHALLRVDAASVQVSELPAPFGIRPVATAVGACGVWVAGADGRLALIDPRDAAALGPAITVGRSIAALAASAGGVWASDPLDGTVTRVSARPA